MPAPHFRRVRKGLVDQARGQVLAPDLPPNASLAVGNGDQAMSATAEMLDLSAPAETAAALRADLFEYCCQDIVSMVMIYQTLRSVAGS